MSLVCSRAQLKSSRPVAVVRPSRCLVKESCHHTGGGVTHFGACNSSVVTARDTDVLERFNGDCMALAAVWDLWQMTTSWSCCGHLFTRPLVIVPIISRLLPNSCSDRCDLNTSPALFYPSSLVLNGRNTILVENCKLDRYRITEEANVLSTCTPSPVLFLSFRVVNFRFLFPFESPL